MKNSKVSSEFFSRFLMVFCILAPVASVEVGAEDNSTTTIPMSASFVKEGIIHAPVAFDHVTLFLPWSGLIQPLRSFKASLESEVDRYIEHVTAANDTYNPTERRAYIEGCLSRHFKKFDKVLRSVEVLAKSKSASRRERRGFWSGVETVATGVNSLGTYTNGRAIDQVISRQHTVVQEIQISRDLIKKLQDNMIKAFKKASEFMADERLTWFLIEMIDEMVGNARQKMDAIFLLEQDTMSPAWITSVDFEELVSGVKARAYARGLEPLGDGPSILLEAPKSHSVNETMAAITLHVPLVPRESKEPMWLMRMSSAKATRKSLALEFTAKRSYLAVSQNLLMHFTLSEEELTECIRHSRAWFCPRRRVIERVPSDCVSSLFYKKAEVALRTCGKQWLADPRAVVEIGQGEFLLQGISHAVLTCPNDDGNATTSESLTGGQVVSIGKGCRLEAPEAVIVEERDSSARYTVHKIGFDLTVNISSAVFDKLELSFREVVIPDVKELAPDPITSTKVFIIVLAVGGVLLLLILMGCVACCVYRREMKLVTQLPEVVDGLKKTQVGPAMEHMGRAFFEYALHGRQPSTASGSPQRRHSLEQQRQGFAAIQEV